MSVPFCFVFPSLFVSQCLSRVANQQTQRDSQNLPRYLYVWLELKLALRGVDMLTTTILIAHDSVQMSSFYFEILDIRQFV